MRDSPGTSNVPGPRQYVEQEHGSPVLRLLGQRFAGVQVLPFGG